MLTSAADGEADHLRRAFPDLQDQMAYFDWALKPFMDWAFRTPEQVPTAIQCFDLLRQTDFHDLSSVQQLHDLTYLQSRPVIIIGRSKGTYYKVTLSTRLQAKNAVWDDKRQLMPKNILGINDNVEPQSPELETRRQGHLPAESKQLSVDDDFNCDAFHVFHQIGSMMYYKDDFAAHGIERASNNREGWLDTGFAVVVDVTPGRARGVWLIYDFWPIELIEGDRWHVDDEDWGLLPVKDSRDEVGVKQVSRIKIATSIDILGPDYEFDFNHALHHEPELVPVVKSDTGFLLRQTADRSIP